MTDAARESGKHTPDRQGAAKPSAGVFVVSFLGAVAAAAAAFGLGGTLGVAVGVVVGLASAGICTALAAQAAGAPAAKVSALLDIALSDQAPNEPPASFRTEPWQSLYREVASSAAAQRASAMALLELEKVRRDQDDSPTEPEVHEPRPAYAADELIGSDEAVPPTAPYDREVGRKAVGTLRTYDEGLASLETDLAAVLRTLQSGSTPAGNGGNGSPAAMVDALVRTAADGIEDLAAGLMRANELTGVAEKVTNRATLLALNAALEATRSGSEAFASIAEETRRLAEYAREATDTISRLSSEIEFKVGDTIASIQSSSEDAKAAVASIGTDADVGAPAVSPAALESLESLVARTRGLRERLGASIEEFEEGAAMPPTVAEPVGVEESEPSRMSAIEIDENHDAAITEGPADGAAADGVPVEDEVSRFEPPAEAPSADASFDDPFEPVTPAGPKDHVEPRPVDPASLHDAVPEANDAPAAAAEPEGETPSTAPIEPKIPDWLEGIQPGGPR